MPTVLTIGRFRFFFFSNEGGEPVHIHVESDDQYAKYWLDPVQLAKSVGYNARELNEVRRLVTKNEEAFKVRWNEHFNS